MTLSHLSVLKSSGVSFHTLVLLICSFYSHGHFRVGHILYDSNIIDDRMIVEIQSNCAGTISWLTTHIIEPFSLPWESDQNTDHILQLIFIDSIRDIDEVPELLTFYRLFVFFSADLSDMPPKSVISKMSKTIQLNHTPIIIYNQINGLMWITRLSDSATSSELTSDWINDNFIQFHSNQKNEIDKQNWFRSVFDVYERNWLISITYNYVLPRRSVDRNRQKFHEVWNGDNLFGNFFVSNLNGSYINRTQIYFENSKLCIEIQIIHHKHRQFYKELMIDYDRIDGDTL